MSAASRVVRRGRLDPPAALCASVLRSPNLWMFDGDGLTGVDPWADLLVGSRRPAA